MKFIFILLALFLLAEPVMAKPVNNTSECLNMYRSYIGEYGASRFIPDAQMRNFIGRCLPDDALNTSMNNSINNTTDSDGSQPQNILLSIEHAKNMTIKI